MSTTLPTTVDIKREVITTVENQTPASKPERVAIAYNPYSVDSLMAASLALYLPGNEGARCVPYNPFSNTLVFSAFDRIMFVGVELTRIDFTNLMSTTDVKLDLICYRDSYDWLTSKIEQNTRARVNFFKPNDEYFSDLVTRTDNTATKVLQFMADKHSVTLNLYTGIVDLVARQVSQSYPIMPMEYDLNQGLSNPDEELLNKARIHDLVPKLRAALLSFTPHTEVLSIRITPDVGAYLSHFRHVRYALSRSLHMRAIGHGKSNYVLPISPASELTHGDILHAALQNYEQVLTYEDVGEYRVWRIHSPKVYDRHAIAKVFKPLMTWSEGVVLCAVSPASTQPS